MDYFDILLAKKLNGGGTNAIYKQTLSNLPSPIATFTGADAPIDSLIASIVGVQSGSGDPSPENVRPISGWSSCEVTRTGKNLIQQYIFGYLDSNAGGRLKIDNDSESVLFYAYEGEKYTVSFISPSESVNRNFIGYVGTDELTPNMPAYNITTLNSDTWTATWTGWTVWYLYAAKNTTVEQTLQVEKGETATTYEEPNSYTTTIPFKDSSDNPITVYGGGIDVTGGKLTVTHANIASYNGEAINEPWISSEDAYASGATPTTGAQVVYPLTTPLEYNFTPVNIRSNGVTNISVNCGEVTELKYFSETP